MELLRRFDDERLVKNKPIDVYAVIETCLDVPYDWKYLTPNQSILGLTAFKEGTIWVWPKPFYTDGMMPQKVFLEEGTIVIDSILTEYKDRGAENFTVMHEVFHQVLHKRCFRHSNPDYTHCTTQNALKFRGRPRTSLEICESQANACAAAFLMPAQLVSNQISRFCSAGKLDLNNLDDQTLLKNLASDFQVSQTAMKYRLLHLGLAH
jgi:hypothetical protein